MGERAQMPHDFNGAIGVAVLNRRDVDQIVVAFAGLVVQPAHHAMQRLARDEHCGLTPRDL